MARSAMSGGSGLPCQSSRSSTSEAPRPLRVRARMTAGRSPLERGDQPGVGRPGEGENKLQRCIRMTVYDRLNERVSSVVDRITLASMLGTVDPDESYMYFI